jgi:hypothetical protein
MLGYQRIFNERFTFGRTNLNEINILLSNLNSTKTFLYAVLQVHESRTVSFGVSTWFRSSFSRSFNECLNLIRTNIYGVNILLSKKGKQNKKVNPMFSRHKTRMFFWGFTVFNVRGKNRVSMDVSFLDE